MCIRDRPLSRTGYRRSGAASAPPPEREHGNMTQQATKPAPAGDAQIRDKLYINGAWVKPTGAGMIDVINPTTEEVVGRVPEGTAQDIDKAVKAAKAAFETWSQTTVAERVAYLQKITANLQAKQEEIAVTIAREVGMPIPMSRFIQAGVPIVTFSMASVNAG